MATGYILQCSVVPLFRITADQRDDIPFSEIPANWNMRLTAPRAKHIL